jgi:hypothetical protein
MPYCGRQVEASIEMGSMLEQECDDVSVTSDGCLSESICLALFIAAALRAEIG